MGISLLKIGIKKSKLLGLVLLFLSTTLLAESIRIAWSTPTEREDGTTIQEIEKYNLYYTHNNVLQAPIEVDASANTYTRQNLQQGSHTFQLTSFEDGLESELSDAYTMSTSISKPVKIVLTIELIE